jgi:YD repeat-containing protein
MRRGERDRQMARDGVMGRNKLARLRSVAEQEGWLDAGRALPPEAEVLQALRARRQAQAASLVSVSTVYGQQTQHRDAQGRITGSSTVEGNRTVHRDAQGRITGSSTVEGNRTVHRDAQGRIVGTESR